MWDHIINIYSSQLLCTKIKEFRINEHKVFFFFFNGPFKFSI